MSTLTVAELVKDRRSDELISLPASASVADAVAVMAEREVGAVLVMHDDGLVAGIFSERDLLARVVAAGRDPKATTAVAGDDARRQVRHAGHQHRGRAGADAPAPLPPPAGDRRAAGARAWCRCATSWCRSSGAAKAAMNRPCARHGREGESADGRLAVATPSPCDRRPRRRSPGRCLRRPPGLRAPQALSFGGQTMGSTYSVRIAGGPFDDAPSQAPRRTQ